MKNQDKGRGLFERRAEGPERVPQAPDFSPQRLSHRSLGVGGREVTAGDRDCPGRRSFGSFLSLQKEKNIPPTIVGKTDHGAPSAATDLSFPKRAQASSAPTRPQP